MKYLKQKYYQEQAGDKRKPKIYKRRMSPNAEVLHCPSGGLSFHCGVDTSKQKSLDSSS
jgi:hypothetical protein